MARGSTSRIFNRITSRTARTTRLSSALPPTSNYDDTTSYGPESTTIRDLVAGDYYFYVHDYSNGASTLSTALARSGATVTVTSVVGNRIKTEVLRADGRSAGTIWTVFR